MMFVNLSVSSLRLTAMIASLFAITGCRTAETALHDSGKVPLPEEQIILDDSNAAILLGEWEGTRTFERVHHLVVGENLVTITITDRAGRSDEPRWAEFVTNNQGSWTSRVDVVLGNVYMRAWRGPRKFELFRMDDDTLLLEAKWDYTHPIAGITEAIIQVRKSDYDRRLLKTGRGK